MKPKPFGPIRNLKNPDQHPEESHYMWIALAAIVAVVLAILIILTLIGAGNAGAALLDG